MKRLFFLLTVVFISTLLSNAQPTAEDLTDDYAMWAALICRGPEAARVFQNPTFPITTPEAKLRPLMPVQRMPGLTDALITDFIAKNKRPYSIESKFTGCGNYSLTDKDELARIFGKDNKTEAWRDFSAKYAEAKGYYQLSRPGLDGDKALVYIKYVCNGLGCGYGSYFFYEKEGRNWTLRAKFNITVL